MIRCRHRPIEFEAAIRWFKTRNTGRGAYGIQTRSSTLHRVFPSLQLVQQRVTSGQPCPIQGGVNDGDSAISSKNPNLLQVLEIPVSHLKEEQNSGFLHTHPRHDGVPGSTNSLTTTSSEGTNNWTSQQVTAKKGPNGHFTTTVVMDQQFNVHKYTHDTLALFLPAQFPTSVAPGYAGFATFCFSASIAGSAAMVLSTQTLLLAVGIVGQNVQQASIMAGAFNWVMKDFVGQLGGVLFASQMGKTRAFDTDPKRWRMVAAMALDGATLIEILSPLVPTSMVLPVASVANIGKNIGFLTASASRAALHQAVAISGNLGDVTAKAGSQSIMASLIGTSLGIGLSSLLGHDTDNFAMGFLALTIIHQGCTYLSLQYVPLAHFNRQRLLLVLDAYLASSSSERGGGIVVDAVVPNPTDVASLEQFFPLLPNVESSSKDWLRIGGSIVEVCPDATQLERLLALTPGESYLIRVRDDDDNYMDAGNKRGIDLVFFDGGSGDDVIRGMYHACLLRQALASTSSSSSTTPRSVIKSSDDDQAVRHTHQMVKQNFPHLEDRLRRNGWKTDSDVTTVECSTALRLHIRHHNKAVTEQKK